MIYKSQPLARLHLALQSHYLGTWFIQLQKHRFVYFWRALRFIERSPIVEGRFFVAVRRARAIFGSIAVPTPASGRRRQWHGMAVWLTCGQGGTFLSFVDFRRSSHSVHAQWPGQSAAHHVNTRLTGAVELLQVVMLSFSPSISTAAEKRLVRYLLAIALFPLPHKLRPG